MKATKYTVTLTIEVLSMDSVASIAMNAISQINHEHTGGSISCDDGDFAEWKTEQKSVEF